jgi:hypothetical protein
MLRHEAALAACKLTRVGNGGQLIHMEVIMSGPFIAQFGRGMIVLTDSISRPQYFMVPSGEHRYFNPVK